MAEVFFNQGQYDKALEWHGRALDGRERSLGKDHPQTLNTLNAMAEVFSIQGQYDKALEWYQRALDGREKTRGKYHLGTPVTTRDMIIVLADRGRVGKALELCQQALDGASATTAWGLGMLKYIGYYIIYSIFSWGSGVSVDHEKATNPTMRTNRRLVCQPI
jgi:tetratricopeptide (TPR) repeat protein